MCNVPCACCTLTERRRRNQFNAGKRVQPLQGDCDFLRTLSIIAEAAHDIKRSKTRAKAGGTAVAVAVPFQEVISERGREGSREGSDSGRRREGRGRGGGPDFTAKRDPVRRSVRRSTSPSIKSFLSIFGSVCRMEKVGLIGKKTGCPSSVLF